MLSFNKYTKTNVLLENNLKDFVNFASDFLNIQEIPKIKLVKQRTENMTTANYCPGTKSINVYSKNRAFFDIARSLAHELVHHMQNETGKELNGESGSDCENEANAKAGQIIRMYGKKNPDFYN